MPKAGAPIAITLGEPAGIGPDILLAMLQEPRDVPLCLFGDPACLEQRARQLGLPNNLLSQPHLTIETVKLNRPSEAGVLTTDNAACVVESIRLATQACLEKRCRALVTNPVHKGVINDAGIDFTGHTEYLALLTHTQQTVMMLASPSLKVALATTHLALSKVPKAITEARLTRCIEILDHDLQTHFHIASPHILVCGLNPHAGEAGHFGDEEIRVIIPTLEKLRQKGYHLTGPVSADTAFIAGKTPDIAAVLAMYHDQGLPVIKAQDFGETVNITLGLPIVRTSVDHGTALSLAGTGKASHDSLKTAIHSADVLSTQAMPTTTDARSYR